MKMSSEKLLKWTSHSRPARTSPRNLEGHSMKCLTRVPLHACPSTPKPRAKLHSKGLRLVLGMSGRPLHSHRNRKGLKDVGMQEHCKFKRSQRHEVDDKSSIHSPGGEWRATDAQASHRSECEHDIRTNESGAAKTEKDRQRALQQQCWLDPVTEMKEGGHDSFSYQSRCEGKTSARQSEASCECTVLYRRMAQSTHPGVNRERMT